MILTFKYRIKDATTKKYLERHARAVNYVWNYCCEIQKKTESIYRSGAPKRRWPTHFDYNNLTAGTCRFLDLHATTINEVCRQFANSRNKAKRSPKFRVSGGPRRSLGWVPFTNRCLKIKGDVAIYKKRKFRFWKTRDIPQDIRTGSFSEDSKGHWYLCVQCEVPEHKVVVTANIGIDLGLKTLATCSNGDTIAAMRHFRRFEAELAIQQRAGNKARVRAIHAKIKNSRKDQLHKASTKIARENSFIVVGDVNSAKLKRTKMGKSVSDAGWSEFRYMLRYKARRHGATYIEANEQFTSQTCSDCGVIGGPKGIAGLGIRQWECSSCGASHDRDVNAAKNILAVGMRSHLPAEEISSFTG